MREPDPGLRHVPLDRLELSPDNARKTPADDAALAELKASIAAHGLLENLVVRPVGDGEDARYAVIAGGRRLAAMKALARDGAVAADFPVPCRVCGDGALPRELSLAENTVRVAMHPADQVETFRRLADDGATAAGIAARFGVAARTVEQRLRLGGAAPVLLDALRAGEIDLETLTAFAVTADQGRQTAVWEQVKARGLPAGVLGGAADADRGPHPGDLRPRPLRRRRRLRGGRRRGGPRPVRRGGRRRRLARRPQAVARLGDGEAGGRRRGAADPLALGRGADRDRLGRHRPLRTGASAAGEPTPEEQAEIERLRTRHDALAARDESDWSDDPVAEAERIEERLDEVHTAVEARAVYRREDLGLAGCIVHRGRGRRHADDPGAGPARGHAQAGARDGERGRFGTGPGAGSRRPGTARPGASTRRRSRTGGVAPPTRKPRRARRPRRHRPGRRPARRPRGHRQGPARLRLRRRLRPVPVPAGPCRVRGRLPGRRARHGRPARPPTGPRCGPTTRASSPSTSARSCSRTTARVCRWTGSASRHRSPSPNCAGCRNGRSGNCSPPAWRAR